MSDTVDVGRHTYRGDDMRVYNWAGGENGLVTVGAFCSIADGVKILAGGEHNTDWVTTFPFSALPDWGAQHTKGHPATRGDVVIGNDVWIGTGATILSGTTIGDGAVIGAQALVRGLVPPYSIFAGNPARYIGYRFEEQVRARLLEICWWNWSDERIKRALPLMLSKDIKSFITAVDGGEL